MFTFQNLFQGLAALSILALILGLVGGEATLTAAVFFSVVAVVFLCAANACKPKS